MTKYPRFTEGQLGRFRESVITSMNRDAEIGIPICGSVDEPKLGESCLGEKCEIEPEKFGKCPSGEELIGHFHTHPHTRPWTNDNDARFASYMGDTVSCVGGNDKAPWIIVGYEEPAPPENLVVRCHAAEKGESDELGRKTAEHEKLEEKCKGRMMELGPYLKQMPYEEWEKARVAIWEPCDKAKEELSDLTLATWKLRGRGRVYDLEEGE